MPSCKDIYTGIKLPDVSIFVAVSPDSLFLALLVVHPTQERYKASERYFRGTSTMKLSAMGNLSRMNVVSVDVIFPDIKPLSTRITTYRTYITMYLPHLVALEIHLFCISVFVLAFSLYHVLWFFIHVLRTLSSQVRPKVSASRGIGNGSV